jgi:tRNA A37 threonylcarbamoyltransferase TsaD
LVAHEPIKDLCRLFDDLMERITPQAVDSRAVTVETELPGCLAVEGAAADALSIAWKKPVIGTNHLQSHTFSLFIEFHGVLSADFIGAFRTSLFGLSLLVFGGSTLRQIVHKSGEIELVGETSVKSLINERNYLVDKSAKAGDGKKFKLPRTYDNSSESQFGFSR